MRDNIEALENRHKRYMKLNKLMNSLLIKMKKANKSEITIGLTNQDCIDIANVLGDEANVLRREINDKATRLKEESIQNLEYAKSILGED